MPEPGSGRVFEQRLRPGIADATGEGRCRLDAIARWLQDVAYADLIEAGFEGRGAWIVRRTRIRVEAFPRFGEELTLRTFCSGIGRFSAERRTSIRGERARVEAVGLWVCFDVDRRRPMRFTPDFLEVYEPSRRARRQCQAPSSGAAAGRGAGAVGLPGDRDRSRRPHQQLALLGPIGRGAGGWSRAGGDRRRTRTPRAGRGGGGGAAP